MKRAGLYRALRLAALALIALLYFRFIARHADSFADLLGVPPLTLLVLAGLFLLDAMGLIIKHLSGSYGAAELSVYRNLFGMVPVLAILWLSADWQARGRRIVIRQWPLAFLRGGFVAVAQFLFYLSLARMEFATASTIAFSMALFVTAFSVPLLVSLVGSIRFLAVVTWFIGVVLVVVLCSYAFTLASLLPLASASLSALALLSVPLFPPSLPTPLLPFLSSPFSIIPSSISYPSSPFLNSFFLISIFSLIFFLLFNFFPIITNSTFSPTITFIFSYFIS